MNREISPFVSIALFSGSRGRSQSRGENIIYTNATSVWITLHRIIIFIVQWYYMLFYFKHSLQNPAHKINFSKSKHAVIHTECFWLAKNGGPLFRHTFNSGLSLSEIYYTTSWFLFVTRSIQLSNISEKIPLSITTHYNRELSWKIFHTHLCSCSFPKFFSGN